MLYKVLIDGFFSKVIKWIKIKLLLLRNTKVQTRLRVSFLICSLIPLLITGIFSYVKSSNAIKSKISTYSVQISDQISQNIQREVDRLVYDSIEIQFSDKVQQGLQSYDKLGEWEKHNLEHELQDILVKKFSFLHDVSDVLIYTNRKEKILAYGDTSYRSFNLKSEYLGKLLKEAYDKAGVPVWVSVNVYDEMHYIKSAITEGDKHNGVILCRAIRGIYEGNQVGYLIIRTNEKFLSNIYKDIDIGKGADTFVVNSQGLVISSRDPEKEVSMYYKNKALLMEIEKNKENNVSAFKLPIEGKDYLVSYSLVNNTDWYVVNIIPFSYINSESYNIGIYTMLVGISSLIMAILLSSIISRSISDPLKKLVRAMNKAKGGELSSNIKDYSKDELAEVTSNFNSMLDEIKLLIESVKDKEKQKRIAEIKALQAQINPHFLSNTLNSVKWLANIQRAENIEKLITALIELLHVSMGKGKELITLREEIGYVKEYIVIEEFRYYDKFKVCFELQEDVLDLKVLKFLLQPIIENSLIHGIEPMSGQGMIIVKAFLDSEKLKIVVTDNGVGISEERMRSILEEQFKSNKSSFSGIGICNIKDRIKMYFGEEYGVYIESIPNLYTTVELTLPITR